MKFREIEPLKFDNRRTISIEKLEDGTPYIDLTNDAEKQYFYLMEDEAMALRDWLNHVLRGNE